MNACPWPAQTRWPGAAGPAPRNVHSVTCVTEMTPRDGFSWHGSIITMSSTHRAAGPSYADPKEGSTMSTESVAVTTAPADVGLRREMGLIGATWSSETSIIGSGWLFGALYAAQAAGPAAIIGWVIGGVAVIFLALVHAEL